MNSCAYSSSLLLDQEKEAADQLEKSFFTSKGSDIRKLTTQLKAHYPDEFAGDESERLAKTLKLLEEQFEEEAVNTIRTWSVKYIDKVTKAYTDAELAIPKYLESTFYAVFLSYAAKFDHGIPFSQDHIIKMIKKFNEVVSTMKKEMQDRAKALRLVSIQTDFTNLY